MSKLLSNCFFVLITSCLFVMQPAMATEGGKGNLVSAEWLAKNLSRNDLVLIDASFGQLYAAKHIAGAVNVDVFTFGGRENLAEEMQGRIQSWGISAGNKVVIYDQGGTFMATSLFFDLYYHGFPPGNLFVLDGGLSKWQATGGAVTKDPHPLRSPEPFASRSSGRTYA